MCSTFPFVSRINIQPDSLIKIQPDSLMCLMFTKSHDPVQFLWKYFTWTFCKQRFLANLSWIICVNESPSCSGPGLRFTKVHANNKVMQTTKSCKQQSHANNKVMQTTKSCKVYQPLNN